jgi:hypothetical protein
VSWTATNGKERNHHREVVTVIFALRGNTDQQRIRATSLGSGNPAHCAIFGFGEAFIFSRDEVPW